MKTSHRLALALLVTLFHGNVSAQFSVSAVGSPVPATGTGGGGTWTATTPPGYAVSSVNVPVAVTNVDSIELSGFEHTYIGDLQMTLVDPTGVAHNVFVRPGMDFNGSLFGNAGDFLIGDYEFVQSGVAFDLPVDDVPQDQSPGLYHQSFTTGATGWPDGSSNVHNTPLSMIQGPAGLWELRIYDWAVGDSGSFNGWTLNGNAGLGINPGVGYCYGDGSGALCPCAAFGSPEQGCATTSGSGATLIGTGSAEIAFDSLVLSVTGGPADKVGLFVQGPNPIANPIGDGILCTSPSLRFGLNPLDSSGAASQTGFGAFASVSQTVHYQYWFRDPGNPCGGLFNFSGGWRVTWQ